MRAGLRLIVSYLKEHPRTYARVMIFTVIVGMLEFAGISSLVPAVGILLGEEVSGIPAPLIKLATNIKPSAIIIAYLFLVAVQMLVSLWNETIFLNTMVKWAKTLARDFFRNILAVEFRQSMNLKPGEAETMIVRNLPFSTSIRHATALFLSDSILSVFYIIIVLFISYYAIFLLIPLIIIVLLLHYFTLKMRVRYSEIAKQKNLQVAQYVSESLSDLRGLLLSRKEIFLRRAEQLVLNAFRALTRNAQINAGLQHTYQPLLFLVSLSTVFIWKMVFDIPNGTILLVLYAFYRAAPKINATISKFGEIIEKSPYDIKLDITRWGQLVPAERQGFSPKDASIVFQDVALRYEGTKRLLQNVRFEVKPGELVCIVGKSGTGKSTILDVICGFHVPHKGIVQLGHVDYGQLDWMQWRARLGLLRPESVVVSGTWVENVAFLNDNPDLAKVEQLLSDVGLLEYVRLKPAGILSAITARGGNLSAGQRQRLLMARLLYRDPQLMILDEPTSNLDIVTETFIHEFLFSLKRRKTIIVVSHRDSVREQADKVYEVTVDGGVNLIKGDT